MSKQKRKPPYNVGDVVLPTIGYARARGLDMNTTGRVVRINARGTVIHRWNEEKGRHDLIEGELGGDCDVEFPSVTVRCVSIHNFEKVPA